MRQIKLPKELEAATDYSTTDLLSWSFAKFHPRLALACSFQAEGSVLIDLIHRLRGNDFRLFTLDTGRLNQETYDCMEAIRARYGIEVEVFFPDAAQVEDMVRQHGMNLFYDSIEKRKLCCGIPESGTAQTSAQRFGLLDDRSAPGASGHSHRSAKSRD